VIFLVALTIILPNQNNDTIKIGVIAPLTGGPAVWGQGSVNMIKIASEEINSIGGINGKMIQLIIEDGKCDSQTAVAAAQKLIQVDGVKFILGGHCSPETVAIVPIIDKAKVFLLAGVTSSDNAVSGSKFAFRTSPATLEQAKITAEIAFNKYNYKKIALVTEEAAFAKSFSEDLKKSFAGTIVDELNYAPGTTEFKSGLLKIKQAKPDAIMVSPQDPSKAMLLLKQMNELDMLDIPLFGNTVFVSTVVFDGSEKLLPANAFTVMLFADPNSAKSLALQKKYKEEFSKDIPYNLYYISAVFDGAKMLFEAIKKCNKNTECVANYFANIKGFDGAAGKFSFLPNGDPVFDSWKEMRIQNGRTALE
jgi:branched-chain amino acid transport system substrate-binding protein